MDTLLAIQQVGEAQSNMAMTTKHMRKAVDTAGIPDDRAGAAARSFSCLILKAFFLNYIYV